MPDDEPDFSDVQGGSSSISTDEQVDRTYTVRPGDSLSKIAKALMGDAKKWRVLYEANKDVVAFIKASDDYQSCLLADLQSQIDAAKDNKKELDPAIKKAIEAKGDANQKLKESVGKAYNAAAAAYKQAHPK